MTPSESIPNLEQRLAALCEAFPAIVAAWLFGSRAGQSARPDSDVDVAVLLRPQPAPAFSVLEFALELERACSLRVDLVVLNRAGELLKHEVRRSGRLVFSRDDSARKQFEIRGRKSFEDFLHLHRRHVQRVLYRG